MLNLQDFLALLAIAKRERAGKEEITKRKNAVTKTINSYKSTYKQLTGKDPPKKEMEVLSKLEEKLKKIK